MSFDGHTYVLNQKLLSLGGDLRIEDDAGHGESRGPCNGDQTRPLP
jgi:hypothetical protein